MKRKEVLQKIIKHQQQIIATLEESKKQFRTGADLDENNTIDPEDLSQQAQSHEMRVAMAGQLMQAEGVLAGLERIEETPHSEVEHGAIIETDGRLFVVGVAFQPIHLEGTEIVGLSEDAPLFHQIQGSKKGDTMQLGPDEVEILDIF